MGIRALFSKLSPTAPSLERAEETLSGGQQADAAAQCGGDLLGSWTVTDGCGNPAVAASELMTTLGVSCPGLTVVLDDAQSGLFTFAADLTFIASATTVGGILKSAKGINLPDTAVNVPAITDRDWECVGWAIANDLDYLALSFVRGPDDLRLLREHLANHGSDIPLIAKIEKSEAVRQIDAIIDAADGLMVARGDLGVEIDVAQVGVDVRQQVPIAVYLARRGQFHRVVKVAILEARDMAWRGEWLIQGTLVSWNLAE